MLKSLLFNKRTESQIQKLKKLLRDIVILIVQTTKRFVTIGSSN